MALKNLMPWVRKTIPVRREAIESPLSTLQREVNRLFDRFFEDLGFGALDWPDGLGSFSPRVDVSETDSEIEVCAELPGVEEKDIDVVLSDDYLTIKGERREEHEESRKEYYRKEQSYGTFHRVIPLPAEVDANRAEASFKKGVLRVRLPKAASARTHRIAVKAA